MAVALLAFGWAARGVAQETEMGDEDRRLMTLNECLDMALDNNLDLQIERETRRIEDFGLEGSYAYYDPVLRAQARHDETIREGDFNPDLGVSNASSTSERDSVNGSLGGVLPLGLNYSLSSGFNHSESTFVSSFGGGSAFNKEYTGNLSIELSQPLLRNFWIDGGRANIRISKRRVERAGLALRLQIMNTVTSVERAYYDLIAAMKNVEVQQQALTLAEQLLEENRKRVEFGAMAPLEESEAKSQVATRRAGLLDAENALRNQQNILKNLITDEFREWQAVDLLPSETLLVLPQDFDLQESWTTALTMRPDLMQLKLDLEITEINRKLAFNQLFPELNVIGGYGRTGSDGSVGFPGELSGAWQDIEDEVSPYHYYGVVLSIPLSNRQARYEYKSTMADKRRRELQVQQYEQTILVQVDDLVRQARSTYERVQARKQARIFAEEALEAEEKKYANGISTSFVVLDLQNQLTSARFQEVRALADYNNALAELALSEGMSLERHHINLEFEE